MSSSAKLSLHPAAGVLHSQLLLDAEKENEQLRKNIRSLHKCRDLLGSVELRLRSGHHVVYASLGARTTFIQRGHLISGCKADSLPLSEFYGAVVSVAGQDVCGISNLRRLIQHDMTIRRHENGVMRLCLFLFPGPCFVDGKVAGLRGQDEIDLILSKNGEEQRLYLERSGAHITFATESITLKMTDELREVTRVFGFIPTYDGLDTHDTLPRDTNGGMEKLKAYAEENGHEGLSDSDESRYTILTALGCAKRVVKLMRKLESSLKLQQFLFKQSEQLLGSVEITHSRGSIRLSLKDGHVHVLSYGSFWRFELRGSAVTLGDVKSVRISVSGIRHDMIHRVSVVHSGFRNGAMLMGALDGRTVAMQEFLSGPVPPETKLDLLSLLIPLDTVRNALNALGIDHIR